MNSVTLIDMTIMKKFYRILLLFVALLVSTACFAQDKATSFDAYIADLNSQCPIPYGDDWVITSVSMCCDTVTLKLDAPAALSMFLPMLTDNTDGVKRLWLRQMDQYGDLWNRFVDALVNEERSLILVVTPISCDEGASIVYSPSDLMKK